MNVEDISDMDIINEVTRNIDYALDKNNSSLKQLYFRIHDIANELENIDKRQLELINEMNHVQGLIIAMVYKDMGYD